MQYVRFWPLYAATNSEEVLQKTKTSGAGEEEAGAVEAGSTASTTGEANYAYPEARNSIMTAS